jgi:7-carboxy-7-deazaguanine synthase
MREKRLKLGINSIYRATEGEGVHIGESQIFVRFQGCTIGCLNCDSKDTWNFEEGSFFELEEVVAKIEHLGKTDFFPLKRVSITGGDPLHPKLEPGVLALVKILKRQNYYVNIEASGSRICPDIFDLVDFISFDFKTPSTGGDHSYCEHGKNDSKIRW